VGVGDRGVDSLPKPGLHLLDPVGDPHRDIRLDRRAELLERTVGLGAHLPVGAAELLVQGRSIGLGRFGQAALEVGAEVGRRSLKPAELALDAL
jgi:hypothetical protein